MVASMLGRTWAAIYRFFATISGEEESSDSFRKCLLVIFIVATIARIYINFRQGAVGKDKEISASNPTNFVGMIGPPDVGKSALLKALDGRQPFGTTVASIKVQSLFIGEMPLVDYPGHPMMLNHIKGTLNDKHVPLILLCVVSKKGHRSIDEAARLLFDIVTQPSHSFEGTKVCVVGMKGDMKGAINETTDLMQLLDEALKNCDGDLADSEEVRRKHAFKDNIVSLKTLKCKKLVSIITSSKNPDIGIQDLREMISKA